MDFVKIFVQHNARIYVADLTETARMGVQLHQTRPLASLVLATSIALFAPFAIMKDEGQTSAMIQTKGAIKTIIVETNNQGHVRALVGNPEIMTEFDETNFNDIPINLAIGTEGTLKIVTETNGFHQGGEVELIKGDLVSDLANYFLKSEQIPSAITSQVVLDKAKHVQRAYCSIFQMLPGHSEQDILQVEQFIRDYKLKNYELDDYIKLLSVKPLKAINFQWQCRCSFEKTRDMLKFLTKQEQEDLIAKYGYIEIVCSFCKQKYHHK